MSISYNPRIVTDGLVLCLDVGNTKSYPGSGTTWTDLSGNGNNGTLTNGPTYSSSNGGSLVFDGTNDYFALNSRNIQIEFQPTQSFSAFCWVYNLTDSLGFIIGNIYGNGTNATPRGWEMIRGGSSTISVKLLSSGSIGTNIQYTLDYPTNFTNKWSYIGYTYTSPGYAPSSIGVNMDSINFYLNGSLYTTGKQQISAFGGSEQTISYTVTQTLTLADRFDASGSIWSVAGPLTCSNAVVYNRALTASEIQQNFNALRGRFGI